VKGADVMAITRFSFLSSTLGFHVNVCVLLPSGIGEFTNSGVEFDNNTPKEKYQTPYLLHGGGGSCTDWYAIPALSGWRKNTSWRS
jgi:hypothetical protein